MSTDPKLFTRRMVRKWEASPHAIEIPIGPARDRLINTIEAAAVRRVKTAAVHAEGAVIECARELFGREVALQLCQAMDKKRAAAKTAKVITRMARRVRR